MFSWNQPKSYIYLINKLIYQNLDFIIIDTPGFVLGITIPTKGSNKKSFSVLFDKVKADIWMDFSSMLILSVSVIFFGFAHQLPFSVQPSF